MGKVLFREQQLSAAAELVKQLRAEALPELTEEENMARSIQMRLQDVDTLETARELRRGIQKFHTLFDWVSSRSLSEVVTEELDGMLSAMNEQEQKQFLTGLLTGFASATGNEMPEGDYEVALLREAMQVYLCEYSIAHLIDPDALPENLDQETARKLLDAYEQSSQEAYTAVAMYLLQVTGEVEQIPTELTPAQIGAMTAASLKVNKTVLAHFLGQISSEEFKKTLKLIAGVLALALLSVVAWQAMKIMYTFAAVGVGVLLAKLGITNTVFVKLVGYMAGSEVISGVMEYATAIVKKTGIGQAAFHAWDELRKYYGKLVPAVSDFWSKLRTRLGIAPKLEESAAEDAVADADEQVTVDAELSDFA